MRLSRRAQGALAISIWLVVVAVGTLALGVLEESPRVLSPLQADFYLIDQMRAVRPEFHELLSSYAGAPRYTVVAEAGPDGGTVTGQLTTTFRSPSDGELGEVVFRLLPNAARIYGGGSLTVREIRRAGQPVEVRGALGTKLVGNATISELEPGLLVASPDGDSMFEQVRVEIPAR